MSELKPCPFCGSTAVIQKIEPRLYRPTRNHPYCVICYNCDLMFGYDVDYGGIFDTEEEAAEAWNRRSGEQERKHGYWIESHEHVYIGNGVKEWTNWYCSECDAPNDKLTDFCPSCGADLRGQTWNG